ncbi:MAG: hypothetical protein JRE28_12485 [Deltaproteobacteria bacterium]|nr:hypothetical protein [Deltaproteobacteria bacterium]
MKLRILQIAVVAFTLFQLGWAQAANLRDVRTGKHEKFTRVVFEFQDNVLFESPEIKGKGEFSVVLLDSSTTLPRLTLFKTGPIQLVHSLEFVRQKSNLIANVRLSFPYFILKAFPLSGPNRVVVDAYPVSSPPEKPEQNEFLREKPSTETSAAPEKKELKNAVQNVLGKATGSQPITPSGAKNSGLKETRALEKAFSNNVSNQIPEKHVESPSSAKGNDMTQIYLLTVLNVLTGVIIVLMIFTLLKKRHMIDLGRLYEIMEFIKTSDESIETIDVQLKNAFKEYDES